MNGPVRQMWLDCWKNLEAARQSFGDGSTTSQLKALDDMIACSKVFATACGQFGRTLQVEAQMAAAHAQSEEST